MIKYQNKTFYKSYLDSNLKKCSKEGGDISYWISRGSSNIAEALVKSSRHGHLNNVKFIVKNYLLLTSLYRGMLGACKGGHIDVINYYIQKGHGVSLEKVCRGGHLGIFKMFQREARLPLMSVYIKEACRSGNIELVAYIQNMNQYRLLEYGFGMACYMGHLELVKWLLDNEVKIYSEYSDEILKSCNKELIEFFVDKNVKFEKKTCCLYRICKKGDINTIKDLIINNENVDYGCGIKGAIKSERHDVLDFLLPFYRSARGNTPNNTSSLTMGVESTDINVFYKILYSEKMDKMPSYLL